MPTLPYETTRIWTRTLERLRLVRALTGESAVGLMDRLVAVELARLKQDGTLAAATSLAEDNPRPKRRQHSSKGAVNA